MHTIQTMTQHQVRPAGIIPVFWAPGDLQRIPGISPRCRAESSIFPIKTSCSGRCATFSGIPGFLELLRRHHRKRAGKCGAALSGMYQIPALWIALIHLTDRSGLFSARVSGSRIHSATIAWSTSRIPACGSMNPEAGPGRVNCGSKMSGACRFSGEPIGRRPPATGGIRDDPRTSASRRDPAGHEECCITRAGHGSRPAQRVPHRFRPVLRFAHGIFVRIRRTPMHILCPEDCAAKYKADVHFLRRIPLTSVTGRELWLLTPWKTWEYFRVLDDRLVEIRADGMPILIERPGLSGIAALGGNRQGEPHPPGSPPSENDL